MEKINDEQKNMIIKVFTRIAVFLSFLWPVWFTSQSLYNTLPFMQEGTVMLEMLSAKAQQIMFLYVTPILSAGIVFGLYVLLGNMAANGVERNLLVFGKASNKEWHKRAFDITAILIALSKGIIETICAVFPLAGNLTRPLAIFFVKIIFIGLLYLAIMKKDTKEMFPFVFSSLMFPTVLVVLFV